MKHFEEIVQLLGFGHMCVQGIERRVVGGSSPLDVNVAHRINTFLAEKRRADESGKQGKENENTLEEN